MPFCPAATEPHEIQDGIESGDDEGRDRDQERPFRRVSPHGARQQAPRRVERLRHQLRRRVVHARDHDYRRDERQDHEPVEDEVPRHRGDERPDVGGDEATARREIAARPPDAVHRGDFVLLVTAQGAVHGAFGIHRPQDPVAPGGSFPLQPRGEPPADVAAARDRGEIVECCRARRRGPAPAGRRARRWRCGCPRPTGRPRWGRARGCAGGATAASLRDRLARHRPGGQRRRGRGIRPPALHTRSEEAWSTARSMSARLFACEHDAPRPPRCGCSASDWARAPRGGRWRRPSRPGCRPCA